MVSQRCNQACARNCEHPAQIMREAKPQRTADTLRDKPTLTIAPVNAPNITALSIIYFEIMPLPTVSATCKPKNKKAIKLKNAAHTTAACGVSRRVDTINVIEFVAS